MDNKNVIEIFKTHPKENKVFFTSDDFAFFRECDATAHAKSLGDRTVTLVTRGEVAGAKLTDGKTPGKGAKDTAAATGGEDPQGKKGTQTPPAGGASKDAGSKKTPSASKKDEEKG